MTHDGPIDTTLDGLLADLRDKVGGMSDWSIIYDEGSAGSVGDGQTFALQSPQRDIISIRNNNGIVKFRWGVDYDTTNGAWNDEYTQSNFDLETSRTSPAMNVKYWLTYINREGFILYYTREEGDQNDGSATLGCAELTKIWDYSNAKNRESDFANIHDSYMGHKNRIQLGAGNNQRASYARGLVNPDSNFSNYPLVSTEVVESETYQNANDAFAPIGTHSLWADDLAGDDTAHRDTITDGTGTTYVVLKEYTSEGRFPLLMKVA